MQRTARFLLWGGLALFLVGAAACGVGCVGALDSAFNNNPESESLAGGIAAGLWMLVISLAMLISGAILKAVARSSREDS